MIVAEEVTNICKVNDNEPLKFEVGSSALKDVGYFLCYSGSSSTFLPFYSLSSILLAFYVVFHIFLIYFFALLPI